MSNPLIPYIGLVEDMANGFYNSTWLQLFWCCRFKITWEQITWLVIILYSWQSHHCWALLYQPISVVHSFPLYCNVIYCIWGFHGGQYIFFWQIVKCIQWIKFTNSKFTNKNLHVYWQKNGLQSPMLIHRDTLKAWHPCGPGESHRQCSASAPSAATRTNE